MLAACAQSPPTPPPQEPVYLRKYTPSAPHVPAHPAGPEVVDKIEQVQREIEWLRAYTAAPPERNK